jgi:hypothetical protein
MVSGGITAYETIRNRMLAQRVHAELKRRGYINIKVLVMNGRFAAIADIPGGIKSENFQTKN